MDLTKVFIGLAAIALGSRSLANGAKHLNDGLQTPGRNGARSGSSRPTIIVPRRATRTIPPQIGQTARMATPTGRMRTTLREVRTLGDRLAVIIDKAHQGKVDPYVISWARREVARKGPDGRWITPEKDTEAEAFAIFKGLRRDIRYTSDVRGVDTYANPRKTLETRAGDCDEYSAVGCAALMAVGIPCRLEVIQTTKSSTPDHIFVLAGVPKENPVKWLSLDASVNMPPGWRAPDSMITRRWLFETE